MRTGLYFDRFSRILSFDKKKIIVIAILARFIAAFFYDAFVSVTDKDILVPDGRFYSVSGWYIALLLSGYGIDSIPQDAVPAGRQTRAFFYDYVMREHAWGKDKLPKPDNETNLFFYIIGAIYFIFGYFPLGVRILNILLSMGGTLLIFDIMEKRFDKEAARIFLLIGLFLPTQCIYSITLSKDFLRMFFISFLLWILHGGMLCLKRQKG